MAGWDDSNPGVPREAPGLANSKSHLSRPVPGRRGHRRGSARAALAGDCGVSQPTAKAWFSVLEATFIAFRLHPFRAGLRKRLVKAPKLYFHDAGLACWLLGIREPGQLRSHPLRGPIFETWVVSEMMKHRANRSEPSRMWFYRDRSGAEVDLVIERPGGVTLVEAKAAATPSPSLFRGAERVRRHFGETPALDVAVVYGGDDFQSRSAGALVPWHRVGELAEQSANTAHRLLRRSGAACASGSPS